MALSIDEAATFLERRRAGLELMREGIASLRDSIDEFRSRIDEGIPETAGRTISLDFDESGVLSRVTIEETGRESSTEEDLIAQFALAFATAPIPGVVVKRLLADPDRLRRMRDRRSLPEQQEYGGTSYPLVLVARAGRPVALRANPGTLLGMTSEEISDEVVRLARLAAEEEEGRA